MEVAWAVFWVVFGLALLGWEFIKAEEKERRWRRWNR